MPLPSPLICRDCILAHGGTFDCPPCPCPVSARPIHEHRREWACPLGKFGDKTPGNPEPAKPSVCKDAPKNGPGTELKKLLRRLGIVPKGACLCGAFACQMDKWGPDESTRQMDVILSHLRAEAKRRNLPFSETLTRLLVHTAIKRARRAATNNPTCPSSTVTAVASSNPPT